MLFHFYTNLLLFKILKPLVIWEFKQYNRSNRYNRVNKRSSWLYAKNGSGFLKSNSLVKWDFQTLHSKLVNCCDSYTRLDPPHPTPTRYSSSSDSFSLKHQLKFKVGNYSKMIAIKSDSLLVAQ